MSWNVQYSEEFEDWWEGLSVKEQDKVDRAVLLLQQFGPELPHPYSSGIRNSNLPGLRELRIQCGGKPYRVLYAFDPERAAVLLIGGAKGGYERWYEEFVPKAERIFARHLATLKKKEKF